MVAPDSDTVRAKRVPSAWRICSAVVVGFMDEFFLRPQHETSESITGDVVSSIE